MGLAISWLSHLQGKDREEFKKTVLNSTLVLGRLREILTRNLESIQNVETGPDQYKEPAWSWHQAHYNGMKAAYKDILLLLTFTDKDDG